MTYSPEEKLKRLAIFSRLVVFIVQLVSNVVLPDHDAGVFVKPLADSNRTLLDHVTETALGGLTRWDGQYFLHVAEYGYTYENTLAFFPLFPLLTRLITFLSSFILTKLLMIPSELLSTHNALTLVAVVLNNALFVKTCLVLHRLSLIVLKNQGLAFMSSVLFCFNPASIFFSAVYSESLFCFLTFYTLLQLEQKTSVVNHLLVGITCVVRSNGLFNIGFLLFNHVRLKLRHKLFMLFDLISCFGYILTSLLFLSYQMYCYTKFCLPLPQNNSLPEFLVSYAADKGFKVPGQGGPWCHSILPFAYLYVQKHYWNVGFLTYYQVKQIPNFLLATPVVVIVGRGSVRFIKHQVSCWLGSSCL